MSGFRGLVAMANRRGFRFSAANFKSDKKPGSVEVTSKTAANITQNKVPDPPQGETGTSRFVGAQKKVPTTMDRYFLVWSGQYKNRDEIPNQLEPFQIVKAREWGRIRVNIYILFVAAFCAAFAVYSGKQAAKRGESVEGENLAWHKKVNEEYRLEQAKLNKGNDK